MRLDGRVEGDGGVEVQGLAGLAEAQSGQASFLANPRYESLMARTRASVVLVGAGWSGVCAAPALIRVADPDRAFAQLAALFAPPPPVIVPGVHPSAIVAPDARLGAGVHIGPLVVIEPGVVVGDGTVIDAQCFIGRGTVIGREGHLYPQVCVREAVRIGDRFIAHCGVVIGGDGYGYTIEQRPNLPPRIEKIAQLGTVVIGDDVEIGANSTIDRARFDATRIGNQVKIDNLVQIGHNVRIGDYSGIVSLTGIAGSVQIGSGVMIWGQVGIGGHFKIGDGAVIGAQSGVFRDVAPGEDLFGTPACSKREFVAQRAAVRQITRLKARLEALEARLAAREGAAS